MSNPRPYVQPRGVADDHAAPVDGQVPEPDRHGPVIGPRPWESEADLQGCDRRFLVKWGRRGTRLHCQRPAGSCTDRDRLAQPLTSKACPSSLPRPTGKSCDEYPFASTKEGGATGVFSRRMINEKHNSTAGGSKYLLKAYKDNRILNGGRLLGRHLLTPRRHPVCRKNAGVPVCGCMPVSSTSSTRTSVPTRHRTSRTPAMG
ncbi:NucA/NucB deoxyribonuclease domain-containing protein [Streptomyces sp. NPDC006510]|uniref:NucA/NucB deoxyribonuclease domain-containing protein n=1 Tax=Streptomyces sp. NPDC006510 TaxID=3155600 RepID=UPI0033BD7720